MGQRPDSRKRLRDRLWYEQAGWCAYCEHWVPKALATLDHIIPVKYEGATTWGNGVMSCSACNHAKASELPPGLFSKADLRRMRKEWRKRRRAKYKLAARKAKENHDAGTVAHGRGGNLPALVCGA